MTEATDAPPDGMTQLRAIQEGRGEGAPIVQLFELELTVIEPGLAVFEGTPDRRFYNPIGSVHGGYAATLLDSACGIAVHTRLAPGQGYTTLELKVSYLRGLSDRSGRVRAEGRVVQMGRRAAFAEATLTDGAGRVCATATSTLLVFDLPRANGTSLARED
jgi:uncharacterized protein (TIGR00369 family)